MITKYKYRSDINQICGAELEGMKSVPHDERYKYYVVEYEGEKEWCYVQRDEDMGCKYVGILSVKYDGKEKGGILPFPCETVGIEVDDMMILDNFIVRYHDMPPIDDCLEEAGWCMGDYGF
ncbi:MAG: hypothetical protein J5767_12685 [Paludibacteraceae bacterium]|nr:hypothetical protein [Paludibacteraceae bacterium]